MSQPTILISGASIAGPALAYWLNRYGWRTTVIERAPELRTGGQNIDIRGAGREVARRMGIEDDIRAANTGERGTQFIDAHGKVVASFPASSSQTSGATAELEILRGELAKILVNRTRCEENSSEYIFGDHITRLDESGDGITVTFANGPSRRFDLVVVAEGMRSRTRELVTGEKSPTRHLGMNTAWLTIPRTREDTDWNRWYNASEGRSITLRPDNVGTIRAAMSFLSPDIYNGMNEEEQKELLREKFHDAGWQAPRLLEAMNETSLNFQAVGQVQLPRWSKGRTVLLGDAAYAPSPVSGMGTSLALVGAYVLAGEIAAHTDHQEAFRSYETIMRPYVEQAQKLPPGTPRLANPKTHAGIKALHAVVKVASNPRLQHLGGLGNRLFSPPADNITLPRYVTVPTTP